MSIKTIMVVVTAAVLASGTASAANLVQNGSFELSSYRSNTQFGPVFGGQGVTDWTGAGGTALEFYFFGGTQTTVSAANRFHDTKSYFYPTFSSLSPDGGNFVALDGDSVARGQISQSISGLTVGKQYRLSFDWGAAQFQSRKGPTTEQIQVGFGTDTASTAVVSNPSKGFTGWFTDKFIFTAKSGTEVLSFLSIGTPHGLPPEAVLDGVSLTTVPEASTWALMLAGFSLVGIATRRRARSVAA